MIYSIFEDRIILNSNFPTSKIKKMNKKTFQNCKHHFDEMRREISREAINLTPQTVGCYFIVRFCKQKNKKIKLYICVYNQYFFAENSNNVDKNGTMEVIVFVRICRKVNNLKKYIYMTIVTY